VYPLFKSLHVVFMYVVTPLFMFALFLTLRRKEYRTMPVLFLSFVVIGFMLGIAYTSLENRHFGAFFVAMLVLSVLPDFSLEINKRIYKKLLLLFWGMMGSVHMVWLALKMG